ncbi:MAG: PadR family transcriptional regulator [Candidatus Micrarchaeota archaeon]
MLGECGIRGMLELFILGECERRPSSGKVITNTAARLTDGNWSPSAGSVYPLLQKMEKQGLIKGRLQARGRGRREISYAVSSKGKKTLEEGKSHMEEGLNSLMSTVNPIFIRIAQGFDEQEVAEARKFWRAMMEMRRSILSQPKEKRRRMELKMFDIAGRQIKLMRREMGIKK